jgi:hypothetical protein
MFEELRNVVGVRSDSLYRDALLLVIIEMPIAFVFIWDLYQKTVIQNGRKLANELELMAVFVVAASLEFGSFASIHMFECPLIACYAVILASRIPKLMWNHAGVIAGLIILNGLSYENTLLGIWSPIAFRSFCADSEHQVLSTIYPIKTITFWEQDKKSEKTPIEWANYINDGIALINKHNIPNNVPIGSLNVADFFSYPMGHLPPSHTYVWLSIGVTIGTSNYPAPEYLLSSCGYVMIPTNPTPSVDFLGKIPAYRSFINSHYHKLDSSTYWELWQMN